MHRLPTRTEATRHRRLPTANLPVWQRALLVCAVLWCVARDTTALMIFVVIVYIFHRLTKE